MMSDEQRSVDALLATACSRLLHAGEMVHQMRDLHQEGSRELYWYAVERAAEHIGIAAHAFNEAQAILLRDLGVKLPPDIAAQLPGGLPN